MATIPGAGRKQAGILPIPTVQATKDDSRPAKSKVPQEGLKVVIRRLPPGMTEEELITILGDKWKVGNGRASWFSFQQGKIARDPAKESRPARAYLQVKETELAALSEVVQNSSFEDAKGTFNGSALVGPPIVELAMYKRVPTGKLRKDGKEGTIDQDDEFMAFLAELANPTVQKDGENENGIDENGKSDADSKATTTPLIEYLREKKANKAKEAAIAKSGKHSRHESSSKGKTLASGMDDSKKRASKDRSSDRPKEKVMILKKQATDVAAEAAKAVAKEITQASSNDLPQSRRAGIARAARILERDLGISAGSAHRRARQEVAKQEASKKPDLDVKSKDSNSKDNASSAAAPSTSAPTAELPTPAASRSQIEKPSRGGRSRKGKEVEPPKAKTEAPAPAPMKVPIILQKRKDDNPAASNPTGPAIISTPAQSSTSAPPTGPKASTVRGNQGASSHKRGNASPALASGATRAFVKHANPSQGVTEALLKEAMRVFGDVTFVEIDRRKGFAYVDFAGHDGLVKAIAASPVSIAQATVQILERKDAAAKNGGNQPKAPAQASGSSAKDNIVTPTAPAGGPAAGPSGEHKRSRRRGGRGRDGGGKEGAAGKDQRPSSSGGPAATPSSAG